MNRAAAGPGAGVPGFSRLNACIIDLDGTLVDTLGDFEVALNQMLAELSRPPVTRNVIERLVGQGGRLGADPGRALAGSGGTHGTDGTRSSGHGSVCAARQRSHSQRSDVTAFLFEARQPWTKAVNRPVAPYSRSP